MDVLNDIFTQEEIQEIKKIRLSQTPHKDDLRWTREKNGILTVKSVYKYLAQSELRNQGNQNTLWHLVWKMGTTQKVKLFLWKALKNALPTKDNLGIRKVTADNFCPRCNTQVESTTHSLITCQHIHHIWYASELALCTDPWNSGMSFFDLIADLCSLLQNNQEKIFLLENLATVAYTIWLDRNNLIFQKKVIPPFFITLSTAKSYFTTSTCSFENQAIIGKWPTINGNCFYLSTDASWKTSSINAGIGFAIWSHSGNLLSADIGLYLSPWDRHEKRYGQEIPYNEYYIGQLQELLMKYGSVQEIWFDGAKGSDAPNMSYYFSDWFSMAKELQGSINIFSDAGMDVRWVGNEKGYAGSTCWSTVNRTSLRIGDGSLVSNLNKGDPRGTDWLPAECDVSIRTGWFWHKSQTPKPLSHLLSIYYKSVGRNCVLLLNVPPNTTGLISDIDVQRLGEFRAAINTIFTVNYAKTSIIKASSKRADEFGPDKVVDGDDLWSYWAPEANSKDQHWIEFVGKETSLKFNVVRIQEAIGLGQRIKQHKVYADGKLITFGTTVGYKRLHRLEEGVVYAKKVWVVFNEARGLPLISSIGLHFDPFWHPKGR